MNREKWLRIRSTKKTRAAERKYAHYSQETRYARKTVYNSSTGEHEEQPPVPYIAGVTFNAGRSKAKHIRKQAQWLLGHFIRLNKTKLGRRLTQGEINHLKEKITQAIKGPALKNSPPPV